MLSSIYLLRDSVEGGIAWIQERRDQTELTRLATAIDINIENHGRSNSKVDEMCVDDHDKPNHLLPGR
jgi:hypothetical protein